MNKYVFRYTFNEEWDSNPETQGVHESERTSYYQAAEEICENRDNQCLDFPSERSVWVLLEDDETPRRYTVDVEISRDYHACEE